MLQLSQQLGNYFCQVETFYISLTLLLPLEARKSASEKTHISCAGARTTLRPLFVCALFARRFRLIATHAFTHAGARCESQYTCALTSSFTVRLKISPFVLHSRV